MENEKSHTTEHIPGRGNLQSDAFPVANVEAAHDTFAVAEDSGGLRSRTAANTVLVTAFVVAIFLPGVQMLYPVFPEHESFENRTLAQRPELPSTWERATAFPSKLESYFDDHFGFRNTLIRWNNLVRVEWLWSSSGRSYPNDAQDPTAIARPAPPRPQRARPLETARSGAIRGKEGWLFRDERNVRRYYKGNLFTAEQLARWTQMFKERGTQFAEHDVRYVVIVAPTAHSIYSEFLPRQFQPLGDITRLDQLASAMQGVTDVSFIDPRPAFHKAKTQLRTHHRTDTHWNDFGAFVAYRQIMQELEVWFENVEPWDLSQFEVRRTNSRPGGLANRLGFRDRLQENAINLFPLEPRLAIPTFALEEGIYLWKGGELYDSRHTTTHPNQELPRAVIVHDSFAWAIMPYLSEHFSCAEYVFQMERCDVQNTLSHEPDVVIQLFQELLLASDDPPGQPVH